MENEELIPNNLVGIINDDIDKFDEVDANAEPEVWVTEHVPTDIMTINAQSYPIVTIQSDGTVIIHHLGGEVEAAKLFWEAIQLEGKSLLGKISDLEEMNDQLEAELDVLNTELMDAYSQIDANL